MMAPLKTSPFFLTDCVEAGGSFLLKELHGEGAVVERLREMGLQPGLQVQFAGRAPFRGPFLLRLGSVVIALRQEEAACILLSR